MRPGGQIEAVELRAADVAGSEDRPGLAPVRVRRPRIRVEKPGSDLR